MLYKSCFMIVLSFDIYMVCIIIRQVCILIKVKKKIYEHFSTPNSMSTSIFTQVIWLLNWESLWLKLRHGLLHTLVCTAIRQLDAADKMGSKRDLTDTGRGGRMTTRVTVMMCNSKNYCQTLEDTLIKQWYKKQSIALKQTILFIQDNDKQQRL